MSMAGIVGVAVTGSSRRATGPWRFIPSMANAMPSRSRRVVERLLENLSTWLEPGFAGMLPRLEQDLGRRAATGREPAMVDDWLASRRALADGRDAFFG
jgi:hypothetical protein